MCCRTASDSCTKCLLGTVVCISCAHRSASWSFRVDPGARRTDLAYKSGSFYAYTYYWDQTSGFAALLIFKPAVYGSTNVCFWAVFSHMISLIWACIKHQASYSLILKFLASNAVLVGIVLVDAFFAVSLSNAPYMFRWSIWTTSMELGK